MHWTLGILPVFQAVFYALSFSQSDGVPPPAPAPVTQTVSPSLANRKIRKIYGCLMKKYAKAIALLIVGFVATLFLLITVDNAHNNSEIRYIGFAEQIKDVNPVREEWQQIKDLWSNGDSLGAINKSLYASWVTMDFGVRTLISRFYFRKAGILESQGRFKEAFDVCSTGVQILKYDSRDIIMGMWCTFYWLPNGSSTTQP